MFLMKNILLFSLYIIKKTHEIISDFMRFSNVIIISCDQIQVHVPEVRIPGRP